MYVYITAIIVLLSIFGLTQSWTPVLVANSDLLIPIFDISESTYLSEFGVFPINEPDEADDDSEQENSVIESREFLYNHHSTECITERLPENSSSHPQIPMESHFVIGQGEPKYASETAPLNHSDEKQEQNDI